MKEELSANSDVRQPRLSTEWLTFWTYVRLPVGAVAGSLEIASSNQHAADVVGVTVAALTVAALPLTVAFGLHKRRLWAWKANWVLLVGESLLYPAGHFASGVEYLGALGVVGVIWFLPNFVYFKKRRTLFESVSARSVRAGLRRVAAHEGERPSNTESGSAPGVLHTMEVRPSWYPNRYQWMVLWSTALVAWVLWVADSYSLKGYHLAVGVAVVGGLLFWQLSRLSREKRGK